MSHLFGGSVGARIAQIRGQTSINDFADSLSVNRKTVTRWEAGEALPDGASLLALLEKFGADPAWVLTGKGASPVLAPDEAALLDNYRHSPEAGKAAIQTTSAAFAKSCKVKKGAA